MSRRSRVGVAIAAAALAALAAGCATPDRWPVFDAGTPPRAEEGGAAPFRVPAAYVPRPTAPESPAPPAPPAPGQPWPLSVEGAVVRALQNNRDLRVTEFEPVIAGTFAEIERGTYDPEVFAGVEYSRERASVTSSATGERFGVEGSDTATNAGVRQALPSGTTLEATVEQERSLSDRAPDQEVSRVGLSVTQSLLQGFGPAVNLASVRQAELDLDASVHELRAFTETLLADVETAYWNYVLAVKEIEIFERSLAVARQQLDEIEQQIEVGLLAEIEAAAARAEVARREQALIDAQSLREERRLRLLRLLGDDLEAPGAAELRATSEPAAEPAPITDLADRLALAERSRPDLGEARLRIEQRRLETVVTRNGLLPRLEFFAALGRTGYGDTWTESARELGGDTYDFSAGVRFRHLLGDRAARARDRAARASRTQAAEALANLRQLVHLDVRLAVNAAERARLQIGATAATRRFQEETLAAEKERFAVGASTALLVAQAQRDLLGSQIAEVEAVVHYRIALTELYLAEGSLLERRGVTLAEARP